MSDAPTRLEGARARDGNVVALVRGKLVEELPSDLYIPPDALEVFLETFEGPLDLLLYLIRRQNLDILDIEVAEITEQYLRYIDLMQALKLDLAGEYLLMAAMLAEIKSRLLLPKPHTDEEEEDPRANIVRLLAEYERIKHAAETLDELPREERDVFAAQAAKPTLVERRVEPVVALRDVVAAFAEAMQRTDFRGNHAVQMEGLSVRERMSHVLARVGDAPGFVAFDALFDPREGRRGVVVTLLAILELAKEALVDVVQNAPFSPIYLRAPEAGER